MNFLSSHEEEARRNYDIRLYGFNGDLAQGYLDKVGYIDWTFRLTESAFGRKVAVERLPTFANQADVIMSGSHPDFRPCQNVISAFLHESSARLSEQSPSTSLRRWLDETRQDEATEAERLHLEGKVWQARIRRSKGAYQYIKVVFLWIWDRFQ